MKASFHDLRWAPLRRFIAGVCLPAALLSCATPAPERPHERDTIQELPASRFPASTPAVDTYETVAELMEAIQRKVRHRLVLPPGHYPASTKVTVEVTVSSFGGIQRLVVSKPSRFRAIDQAVRQAVAKSEPLPVLLSHTETKEPLHLQLVFAPFAR